MENLITGNEKDMASSILKMAQSFQGTGKMTEERDLVNNGMLKLVSTMKGTFQETRDLEKEG